MAKLIDPDMGAGYNYSSTAAWIAGEAGAGGEDPAGILTSSAGSACVILRHR